MKPEAKWCELPRETAKSIVAVKLAVTSRTASDGSRTTLEVEMDNTKGRSKIDFIVIVKTQNNPLELSSREVKSNFEEVILDL